MERLNDYIFCSGDRCFNKHTMELFELEPEYLQALKRHCQNQELTAEQEKLLAEIEAGGCLERHEISASQSFEPEFVAFRLVLGEICNLRCSHCFVLNREHKPVVMTDELLDEIIDKTLPYGRERQIKYHFFGGEPLVMFPKLTRAIRRIESAVDRGEMLKPIFTLTTNGTVINEPIARYLAKHDVGVGISIDGPKAANDLIRGEGVYEKALAGYALLEKFGVRRWFLITPYAEIIDCLPDFVDKLHAEYQFSSITFNTPFHGNDIGWAVPGPKLADMLLEVYARLKNGNVRIESALGPVLYALSSGVKRIYACSIADRELMASISSDGRVSFCAQYWGADVFHQQFIGYKPFDWQIEKSKKCKACIAEYLCGGPCLVNYQKTGMLDAAKCSFYQHLLERLITEPEKYLNEDQLIEESLKPA